MIYGLLHHIAIKKITKTKGEEEKFDEMSGNAFAEIFCLPLFPRLCYFWSESLRKIMFLTLFKPHDSYVKIS